MGIINKPVIDFEIPKFFISAPFGNHISHHSAVSVRGTYTLNPHGSSRLWAAIKSLRYRPRYRGWTNRLGLPNPGLDHGLSRMKPGNVLSIAEIERGDFHRMNQKIPSDTSLELNLSCPNLGKILPWDHIKLFINGNQREYLIAKVSPLTKPEELEYIITAGFKHIHFSNTLPIPEYGGLSGPELIPYTIKLIQLTREISQSISIIAGGGVYEEETVHRYMEAGATHVSLGSIFITKPYTAWKFLNESYRQ